MGESTGGAGEARRARLSYSQHCICPLPLESYRGPTSNDTHSNVSSKT